MPEIPLDRLLARYARPVPGEPSSSFARRVPVSLSADGHRSAACFLRAIAAMHGSSSAELLIGLANYHLQQAAEKS